MGNDNSFGFEVFYVLFWVGLGVGAIYFGQPYSIREANKAYQLCIENLPRSQNCEIKFVPTTEAAKENEK